MPRSVAIVIGVKNAAGFTELPGAWNGADAFANWASGAGFEVKQFVDRNGHAVTQSEIFNAVDLLIEKRGVEKLFVYFTGHGMATGIDNDHWILSGGTRNPGDDVINVGGSLKLTRKARIPYIAFFSDACRTIASGRHIGIAGNTPPIFPNPDRDFEPITLDVFYGSQPAKPSYEIPDTKTVKAHGVFTSCLIKALTGAASNAAIRDETGSMVVTSQSLLAYLQEEVPMETSALPGAATQIPDGSPRSALPLVVALVRPPELARLSVEARLADGSPAVGTNLRILRYNPEAIPQLSRFRESNSPRFSEELPAGFIYGIEATLEDHYQSPESPDPLTHLMKETDQQVKLSASRPEGERTGAEREELLRPPPPSPTLVESYVVDGLGKPSEKAPTDGIFAVVSKDMLTGRAVSELQSLEQGNKPALVSTLTRDDPVEERVESIARNEGRQHFESETGLSVLGAEVLGAHMPGGDAGVFQEDESWHIRGRSDESSSVLVDIGEERFAAVAMLDRFIGTITVGPLGVEHVSYLPADYALDEDMAARARRSLALASVAAQKGHFEVAIDDRIPFAEELRIYKHYNPVLGIFAAYAYSQNDATEQIRDMVGYFQERGQPVPFDVAMLAGINREEGYPIVPSFPMLTQGWAFLGPDDSLHPAIAHARRSLAPSLWATPTGEGGRDLAQALARGEVK